MHYSELSKAQKRCVDHFLMVDPSLSDKNSITRVQVEEIWPKVLELRKTTGVVVGYPMWLVKGKKVSRGVYVFPGPNAVHTSILEEKTEKPKDPIELEFYKDCEAYGIQL